MRVPLIALLCVLYASAQRSPCEGSSYGLPVAECDAWQDLYDGLNGGNWNCNSLTWEQMGRQRLLWLQPSTSGRLGLQRQTGPCGCNMGCNTTRRPQNCRVRRSYTYRRDHSLRPVYTDDEATCTSLRLR